MTVFDFNSLQDVSRTRIANEQTLISRIANDAGLDQGLKQHIRLLSEDVAPPLVLRIASQQVILEQIEPN